jgi:hypothetical protein
VVAIGIFLSRRAGVAMDRVVIILGSLVIVLTGYITITSDPPVGTALRNVVLPPDGEFLVILTLIGGTVGGYIMYAGAHRLLDSGVSGPPYVRDIDRAAVGGVLLTGLMRAVLFLAILGVVAGGATLDPANPTASAFQHAVGQIGLRVFGVVLWAGARLLAFNGLLLPVGFGVLLWWRGSVRICCGGTGIRGGCSAWAARRGCSLSTWPSVRSSRSLPCRSVHGPQRGSRRRLRILGDG